VRALLRRLVHPPNRWSLLALLLLPAILLFPAMVAHLLHAPLVMPVRHGSISVTIAVAAMTFLYNVLFVAVLEEPGWRGFLLDRLQQRFSPLLASLIVWLLWAVWHAPLDFSRPVPFSLGMYLQVRVIFLLHIVMILTWLYNRSGRSIQATAIFHASMNTFPFVLPYFRPGLALLFVVAAYAVVADRMWRRADTREGSG
jgi:membrane protease YdiL (CAAX protease family)